MSFFEIKTDDPEVIIRALKVEVEDGKAALVTIGKDGNFHRLSVLERQDEPPLT